MKRDSRALFLSHIESAIRGFTGIEGRKSDAKFESEKKNSPGVEVVSRMVLYIYIVSTRSTTSWVTQGGAKEKIVNFYKGRKQTTGRK